MTREEAMRNIEEVANFLDNRGMTGLIIDSFAGGEMAPNGDKGAGE